MTTRSKKPVHRELTTTRIDGRNLIVGILPNGHVSVRPKGLRKEVAAPAVWIYEAWQRIEARAERMRRRRERRDARIAAQTAMSVQALEDSRK